MKPLTAKIWGKRGRGRGKRKMDPHRPHLIRMGWHNRLES
jgi:hypothetical protein